MAVCYLQWGKYEEALDAAQQDLALRQQLDDLPTLPMLLSIGTNLSRLGEI
jgi:hypothetical protein